LPPAGSLVIRWRKAGHVGRASIEGCPALRGITALEEIASDSLCRRARRLGRPNCDDDELLKPLEPSRRQFLPTLADGRLAARQRP
jgi:hypothetical protein